MSSAQSRCRELWLLRASRTAQSISSPASRFPTQRRKVRNGPQRSGNPLGCHAARVAPCCKLRWRRASAAPATSMASARPPATAVAAHTTLICALCRKNIRPIGGGILARSVTPKLAHNVDIGKKFTHSVSLLLAVSMQFSAVTNNCAGSKCAKQCDTQRCSGETDPDRCLRPHDTGRPQRNLPASLP